MQDQDRFFVVSDQSCPKIDSLRLRHYLTALSAETDYIVPQVWYGIVEFNVPLDTVYVTSEMGGPEQ